jgi:hypothetical protein
MAFSPVLYLLNLLPDVGVLPFEPGSAAQTVFDGLHIIAYFIPFDRLMPLIIFCVSFEVFRIFLVIFRFLKQHIPFFGRFFGG